MALPLLPTIMEATLASLMFTVSSLPSDAVDHAIAVLLHVNPHAPQFMQIA